MDELSQILKEFDSYLLTDQPKNDLPDRYDMKYVFHLSYLNKILKLASDKYKRLNVNEALIPVYESLYYDTEQYRMYLSHHNKILNRYKIRTRKYADTGVHFLEIKFKSNKRITQKSRIQTNGFVFSENKKDHNFILENTPYNPKDFVKSLHTKFQRITLSNNNFNERITIDLNLEFSFMNKKKSVSDIVICEVKKSKRSEHSAFEDILQQKRVKPFGISKYCLGNYYLNNFVKHNLYKEKVILLKKIADNYE